MSHAPSRPLSFAAPAAGDQEHMKLLTKLARALVRKDFTDALRAAGTPEEVVRLVSEVVEPPETSAAAVPVATPAPAAATASPGSTWS